MLQRAASNAYTWWWASHIRTRQSKWLDNSLNDMEEKVKFMLNIIEEDADSFAKKAEMYYKRRPELLEYIQDLYKSYRALAERYDHLSGELHKANNTIATVFPDQVHFGVDDEDDLVSPESTTPGSRKPLKIPLESQHSTLKKATAMSSSSRKTLERRSICSQMSADRAQKEIDRLQKGILTLQTEKEFVKGSYESGLAKYWDIEKRIVEMQERLCGLQDEFSSASIEDNEARALMVVTALKSCQGTILALVEQQKKSMDEASLESQRIKNARKKLRSLKCRYGHLQEENQQSSSEISGESTTDYRAELIIPEQELIEVQSVFEKVRRKFATTSEDSVLEHAEKVDGLVSEVIGLETTVSSQTAQIERLRMETDGIQKHLESLEEEKETSIDNSRDLSQKFKQAEGELNAIQVLDKSVREECAKISAHFSESYRTFQDLSYKLQATESDQQTDAHRCEEAVVEKMQQTPKASNRSIDETDNDTEQIVGGKCEEGSVGFKANSNSQEHGGCNADECQQSESCSAMEQKDEVIKSVLSEEERDYIADDDPSSMNKEQGDSPSNWQQLFLDGLEDREKILLAEYTSVLRNYREMKRKLTEAEKKNQDHLFQSVAQMRNLRNAFIIKDEEIRSLRRKLSFLETGQDEKPNPETTAPDDCGTKETTSLSALLAWVPENPNNEAPAIHDVKSISEDKVMNRQKSEVPTVLSVEEKFRREIDCLLDENLEFWLRFSSSIQQIQKYRVDIQELQAELLKPKCTTTTTTLNGERLTKSDAIAMCKQLKDLQKDLSVWTEQNALLKEELRVRFSSLCDINLEILKSSKEDLQGEGTQLTAYEAAKFQGEVVNMQQENNKVENELQMGLDHVRGLQAEVEKALKQLNETFDLPRNSYQQHFRNLSGRTKIPLRSFLFGVKAKPKKPSIFSCMNQTLQKQYSDLAPILPPS